MIINSFSKETRAETHLEPHPEREGAKLPQLVRRHTKRLYSGVTRVHNFPWKTQTKNTSLFPIGFKHTWKNFMAINFELGQCSAQPALAYRINSNPKKQQRDFVRQNNTMFSMRNS